MKLVAISSLLLVGCVASEPSKGTDTDTANDVPFVDEQVDIRASLGTAVNCPAIAQAVSTKCYWGYCVGHKAELTEICERGLDEVVDRVHDEFTATKLDLVQLDSGTATLSADASSMTGTWSAQINVGQGLRNAPATFTAAK